MGSSFTCRYVTQGRSSPLVRGVGRPQEFFDFPAKGLKRSRSLSQQHQVSRGEISLLFNVFCLLCSLLQQFPGAVSGVLQFRQRYVRSSIPCLLSWLLLFQRTSMLTPSLRGRVTVRLEAQELQTRIEPMVSNGPSIDRLHTHSQV